MRTLKLRKTMTGAVVQFASCGKVPEKRQRYRKSCAPSAFRHGVDFLVQGKKKSGLADSLQLLPAAGQARSLRQNNSTSIFRRAGRIGVDGVLAICVWAKSSQVTPVDLCTPN